MTLPHKCTAQAAGYHRHLNRVVHINFCLTPGKYYSGMGNDFQASNQTFAPASVRSKPGIWLALAIALGLHLSILLLPLPGQVPDSRPVAAQIELRLTSPGLKLKRPRERAPLPDGLPTPAPSPATGGEKPVSLPLAKTPSKTVLPVSPDAASAPFERDLEHVDPQERARLTRAILSSPFITEESATDQLFGQPTEQYSTKARQKSHAREFHIPDQQNLLAMLDKPMQELPFEYTPGLIRFAYEPGIKGKLQRFGDKITPEFGWITRYGTEVRCIWVLIIAACGWK